MVTDGLQQSFSRSTTCQGKQKNGSLHFKCCFLSSIHKYCKNAHKKREYGKVPGDTYTKVNLTDWKTCIMQCHDMRLHGLLISACPHPPLAVSLPQLKSPGSCSSHVASSARPESAHPPILLPWHFQENPSRLGAWLINPRERGRKGRGGGGRECYADLAGIVLSAGSIRASEAHCNW